MERIARSNLAVMARRLLPLLLVAVITAGCDTAAAPTTTTTAPRTTTTTTTITPTTTEPLAVCLSGDIGFVDDGVVAALGREAGDASVLTSVAIEPDLGCERITFGFATADGAPASSLGRIDVRLRRDLGLVRISLPDEVTTAAITDALLETDLVDAFYVVRSDDRSLYVDLHLAAGVAARAVFADTPVQLVVDLRPGDLPLASQPTRGFLAVVLTPAPGPAGYPLRVTGYARPFEASLVWRLYQDEQVVNEGFTMTTDYIEAWGEFEFEVTAGPSGLVGLFAGDYDQERGGVRGARVVLEIP